MNKFVMQLVGMGVALFLFGCGNPNSAASSAASNDQTNSPGGVDASIADQNQPSLEADGTLVLPDVTRQAFAITTAVVQSKPIANSQTIPFQVFREADEKPLPGLFYRSGFAYALAMLEETQPELRREGRVGVTVSGSRDPISARIVSIDVLPGSTNHQREAVVEIPDQANLLELSQSVEASITSAADTKSPVIEQAAVLDTTSGTFAYVQNSEGYKRIAIKTGASAGAEVQIVDGLKTGDVVVTSPVQTLWLTELKLQGGGGE